MIWGAMLGVLDRNPGTKRQFTFTIILCIDRKWEDCPGSPPTAGWVKIALLVPKRIRGDRNPHLEVVLRFLTSWRVKRSVIHYCAAKNNKVVSSWGKCKTSHDQLLGFYLICVKQIQAIIFYVVVSKGFFTTHYIFSLRTRVFASKYSAY